MKHFFQIFLLTMMLFVASLGKVFGAVVYDFVQESSSLITQNHPIYSSTDDAWKHAFELKVGESVLTYAGESLITHITLRTSAHTDYNLEVKDLHNFLVGKDGVVAHNGCVAEIFKKLSKTAGQHSTYALNKITAHKVAAKALSLSGNKIDNFANLVEAKDIPGLKALGFNDAKIEGSVVFVSKGNVRYRAPKLKSNSEVNGNIEYKPSNKNWSDFDNTSVKDHLKANNHIVILEP